MRPNTGKYGPEKTPYLDTFDAVLKGASTFTLVQASLTLSRWRLLLRSKSMGRFLYDNGLRLERIKTFSGCAKNKRNMTSNRLRLLRKWKIITKVNFMRKGCNSSNEIGIIWHWKAVLQSIYLSVYLSIYLFIYLSIYLD